MKDWAEGDTGLQPVGECAATILYSMLMVCNARMRLILIHYVD